MRLFTNRTSGADAGWILMTSQAYLPVEVAVDCHFLHSSLTTKLTWGENDQDDARFAHCPMPPSELVNIENRDSVPMKFILYAAEKGVTTPYIALRNNLTVDENKNVVV